jgi:hypothetical protein
MAERGASIAPPAPGSTVDAAVAALRAARDGGPAAEDVAKGEGLTSMNRLLQWGAANSSGPGAAAEAARALTARTPAELRKDREWLDAAFPDMFGEVKHLTSLLTGVPVTPDGPVPAPPSQLSDETLVDILNGLEEFMADLNYATSIAKLGTLAPVVDLATHRTPAVRAAALWVLGTAMQDVADVKAQVLAGGGLPPIVAGLTDAHHAPRAKACMAASALLRHAGQDVRRAFVDAGGLAPLRSALVDETPSVRRRAQFLLQHAHKTGLSWFADEVLRADGAAAALVAGLGRVDPADCAMVEAAAGALAALADHDRIRLLDAAPTLPGVIARARAGAAEADTRAQLDALLSKLTATL